MSDLRPSSMMRAACIAWDGVALAVGKGAPISAADHAYISGWPCLYQRLTSFYEQLPRASTWAGSRRAASTSFHIGYTWAGSRRAASTKASSQLVSQSGLRLAVGKWALASVGTSTHASTLPARRRHGWSAGWWTIILTIVGIDLTAFAAPLHLASRFHVPGPPIGALPHTHSEAVQERGGLHWGPVKTASQQLAWQPRLVH